MRAVCPTCGCSLRSLSALRAVLAHYSTSHGIELTVTKEGSRYIIHAMNPAPKAEPSSQ